MQTCSTFSPDSLDLHELLSSNPAPNVYTAARQLLLSIADSLSAIRMLQPLLGKPAQRMSKRVQSKLQAAARAQLGLAEGMGWALVAAWMADTGELAQETMDREATRGFDAGLQQDGITEQHKPSQSSSHIPRRAPIASAYVRFEEEPEVVLQSDQEPIWVWVSVLAVVFFFLCSGVSRYV